MKKIVLYALLTICSHASNAETQLFSNFDNPTFEKNRKFIEQVYERFSFDSAVLEIFTDQIMGPILNSFASESACIKTLGGDFVFAKDLLESRKYDEQLKTFFLSTDGPRKARVFSGIILGTLNDTERSDLLTVPSKSKLVNKIMSQHFISMLLSTHQSAFVSAAQYFYRLQCP